MKKKDPYLEELEKIDNLEGAPEEESEGGGSEDETEAPEEATKIDFDVPPSEAEEIDVGQPTEAQGGPVLKEIMDLAPDIPVQVVAVMGRKSVTVKDLLALRMGQVVELDKAPGETVDLVANGKVIGKGELVEVDGKLGIRVLKLYK